MNQEVQIKKLANFDLDEEDKLKRVSVFRFLFHLQAMHDENNEE
jgi:hypothetical protein